MKLKLKKTTIYILVLSCILVLAIAIGISKSGTGSDTVPTESAEYTETTETVQAEASAQMPWEVEGAKRPEDYTMEDFESLTPEQQKIFLETIGKQGYETWLKETNIDEETLPWKQTGAKQPQAYSWAEYQALGENEKKAFMATLGPYKLEQWLQSVGMAGTSGNSTNSSSSSGKEETKTYTWEEYQALSFEDKKAFVDSLGIRGFQEWLKKAQGQKVNGSNYHQNPWEKDGAKQPKDYTLEEYEALTPEEQTAFQIYLGTKAFKAWQEQAKLAQYPWGQPNAKQPKDYTWEEYNALSQKQKTAFQEYMGAEEFGKWKEESLKLPEYPWEKDGAKQPGDYTWKEYKALDQDQQYAFQSRLGSAGMKTWLQKQTKIPWEQSGAKKPKDYTLEEYKKLTEQQQLAFQIDLGAAEFEMWQEEAQHVKEGNPWEKPGAKQPKDYTKAEYDALTESQQMAFQNYLGAEFDSWLNKPEENPWDKSGAKQPKDYTKAEYDALTESQQMAFQNHLGAAGFEAWLNKVQSSENPAANPWEKPGAKQPKDYTKAEFDALTADQQMAFQTYLGAEFEAWLSKQENQAASNPWEKPGAKQPKDYSKAEFDALTAEQQMAFQNYLGAEFEVWLNKVQSSEKPAANPWEQPGATQPKDYTWDQFNALTAEQQMAFQNHLGEKAFDEWLKKNQPSAPEETYPWDIPGATQPMDYTWDEFNALSGDQQMAFQYHLGDDFITWLDRNMPAA